MSPQHQQCGVGLDFEELANFQVHVTIRFEELHISTSGQFLSNFIEHGLKCSGNRAPETFGGD